MPEGGLERKEVVSGREGVVFLCLAIHTQYAHYFLFFLYTRRDGIKIKLSQNACFFDVFFFFSFPGFLSSRLSVYNSPFFFSFYFSPFFSQFFSFFLISSTFSPFYYFFTSYCFSLPSSFILLFSPFYLSPLSFLHSLFFPLPL